MHLRSRSPPYRDTKKGMHGMAEQWQHDGYRLTTDPAEIDLLAVHAFLRQSYWAQDIPLDVLQQADVTQHLTAHRSSSARNRAISRRRVCIFPVHLRVDVHVVDRIMAVSPSIRQGCEQIVDSWCHLSSHPRFAQNQLYSPHPMIAHYLGLSGRRAADSPLP